jgi:hypothetical protein
LPDLTSEQQQELFRKFTRWLGLVTCLIVLLPTIYGVLVRPENSLYLGIQYNIDDHMVYSAWMRQAMEGRLLFENRFTIVEQPGLTLHLYFLILGWIAKIVGIPVAMHLGRIAFCFLSILALGRLIEKIPAPTHGRKIALSLAVFGGGLGFLVWHTFGQAIVKPAPEFIAGQMLSRLPADVWQPEGFFLYGAMTNGLFMVSAFLILGTLVCALETKDNPKAAWIGAGLFGLLMNIHSYDVLIIGLSFVGFLVALVSSKHFDGKWLQKMLLISSGAIPFALWFVYVLKNDPVFQARAATETFSANYRSIFFGYILMMVMALPITASGTVFQRIGIGAISTLHVFLYFMASGHLQDGYFMSPAAWTGAFVFTLIGIGLWSYRRETHPALLLIFAWAAIGLIAPYFPALFQRKLMMLLGVPWGILAGLGISKLLEPRERGQRNLLTSLGIVVVSATGIQWVSRELLLMRNNVSNTTVHSVYQPRDIFEIIKKLEPLGREAIVIACPGIPSPRTDEQGQRIEDVYDVPAIPDFNPFVTGLAGSRTIAGHWSETPDYQNRRNELTKFFFNKVQLSEGDLSKATHLILATQGVDGRPPISSFGEVLYEGTAYSLVKITR